MPVTRICIVRHGETAWNAERRIQGQLDIPLSAVGQNQAAAVAEKLVRENFAAIYSSDLGRARSTAEVTAWRRRQPLQLRAELRERHFGVFQGLTYDEARAAFPTEFERHQRRDPDFPLGTGETLRQVAGRIAVFLDELAQQHRGEQVLIFTHGGVLDIAYRHASGKPLSEPRDFEIPNAALNWIRHAGGKWSIDHWAERNHLAGTLDELAA